MEREFDAYKLSRSMYPSIFNSFPVIRTESAKNRRFHIPQPTFLFPLGTPLGQLRYMLYGWKENSMLTYYLAACAHLTITVSETERDICEKKSSFYHTPLQSHNSRSRRNIATPFGMEKLEWWGT